MSDQPRTGESVAVASRAPREPGADDPDLGVRSRRPGFRWLRFRRPGSRRREPAVWLVAPGTLFFVLIVGIPLAIVVWTSFLRIGSGNIASWATAPFAGVSNYSNGLTGPNVLGVSVLESVWISIKFSVLATLASTPIAFFAALSVYHRFRGRALLRSIYLVPYVIPGFVIALLAQLGFHDTSGAVDRLLHALHLAPASTFWLIGPNAFWAMTFTEVWEVWPFIYLLLLAGLQAISRDQLDAATVDGAGWWARLRYIVIPQLKGIYALAFALSTLFHFGNFTLPYIMFGNTRPASTVTLPINIYYIAFNGFDFGVASATAVFNVLILAVPAAVYLWVVRVRPARGRETLTAKGTATAKGAAA
ncbi:MAG TPA: sugar ABC transporter permease [Trebonia sp.]|nr:sugar ABC transporter permease [Trebonia sp.]